MANPSLQRVQVLIVGQPAGVIDTVSSTFQQYESQVFDAAAGSHTVTLKGLNPDSVTAFVDDLKIAAR